MERTMDYFTRLQDLVQGWGYSENEAREMLAEDNADYGYDMYDFEC